MLIARDCSPFQAQAEAGEKGGEEGDQKGHVLPGWRQGIYAHSFARVADPGTRAKPRMTKGRNTKRRITKCRT